MKKNIFLIILIGIFIGMGLCYFFYDKLFYKEEIKEEILDWKTYEDNVIKTELFLNLYEKELDLNMIFKEGVVKKDDFTDAEVIAILFQYYKYKNNGDNYSSVSVASLDKCAEEFFGESLYNKIAEVRINNYEKLIYDSTKDIYSVVDMEESFDSYIYVNDYKLDGAYKKSDLVYYDYSINFVKTSYKKDGNVLRSIATDFNFNNVVCKDKKCITDDIYTKYRIIFKYSSEIGSYIFDNAYMIGSEIE